jgi:hypothetical protein
VKAFSPAFKKGRALCRPVREYRAFLQPITTAFSDGRFQAHGVRIRFYPTLGGRSISIGGIPVDASRRRSNAREGGARRSPAFICCCIRGSRGMGEDAMVLMWLCKVLLSEGVERAREPAIGQRNRLSGRGGLSHPGFGWQASMIPGMGAACRLWLATSQKGAALAGSVGLQIPSIQLLSDQTDVRRPFTSDRAPWTTMP